MPLLPSDDDANGVQGEGWKASNQHVKSNDTNHRDLPNREFNKERTEYVAQTASVRQARVRYFTPPPYHTYDNYRDYRYYHEKLPVRESLPAQRIPQYYFPPNYFHGPKRTKIPQLHVPKENDLVNQGTSNMEDDSKQRKRKVDLNDDRSMIEDAELLVSLFDTVQKKNNYTKPEKEFISPEKSSGRLTTEIVPSNVEHPLPIKTEEISSPMTHPLSQDEELSSQQMEEKSRPGSPRGSADSHHAPYTNQMNQSIAPPYTKHPYAHPPSLSAMPPYYPNYNVPPHIPFPLESNHHRPYLPPPHNPYCKFHLPYPHILPRPRESHFRPHLKEDGPYTLNHDSSSRERTKRPIILKRKCAWRNCPELEQFLINNRDEYLKHSAMNYTSEQKKFNNDLTERLLEEAKKHGYAFDLNDFNFVTIRDRIRCFYKSYVQNCKKRGIAVGYDEKGNRKDGSPEENTMSSPADGISGGAAMTDVFEDLSSSNDDDSSSESQEES